jgi:putative DNA primase/helicase
MSAPPDLTSGSCAIRTTGDGLWHPDPTGSRAVSPVPLNPAQSIDVAAEPMTQKLTLNIEEFLARPFPPREMTLGPILPQQGVAMLYAPRGCGKTHVALGMGYTVATGTAFLEWKAPKPRKTVYIDGEMPAVVMQERIAAIVAASQTEPPDPGFFRIMTPDLFDGPIPNLGTPEGQFAIDQAIEDAEFVIFDNLSALVRGARENEADGWQVVQDYLLLLRRRGVTVLMVHHAGKGGNQRGTSRREDVLDTVIALRRPADYEASQGARFEVHIEKGRDIVGDDAKAFEAQLEVKDNAAIWTTRAVEDAELQRIVDLKNNEDMSVRDIAEATGMPKSSVQRRLNKAKALGLCQ